MSFERIVVAVVVIGCLALTYAGRRAEQLPKVGTIQGKEYLPPEEDLAERFRLHLSSGASIYVPEQEWREAEVGEYWGGGE